MSKLCVEKEIHYDIPFPVFNVDDLRYAAIHPVIRIDGNGTEIKNESLLSQFGIAWVCEYVGSACILIYTQYIFDEFFIIFVCLSKFSEKMSL